MDGAWWAGVACGDAVESAGGEAVGVVVAVGAADVTVEDRAGGRTLRIPRAVCRRGPRGGIRLCCHPVRAAGVGPERYRRRGNLGDEWLEQQSDPAHALIVEGADAWHAVHLDEADGRDGGDAGHNAVDCEDNLPTEIRRG